MSLERELTRTENELAAMRRAYDILLNTAVAKLSLLDRAEHDRDQYLAALRRIETLISTKGYYFESHQIRACYADVPGVAT